MPSDNDTAVSLAITEVPPDDDLAISLISDDGNDDAPGHYDDRDEKNKQSLKRKLDPKFLRFYRFHLVFLRFPCCFLRFSSPKLRKIQPLVEFHRFLIVQLGCKAATA